MAKGKRYYWIKLKESFMTSDTVDFLMEQPNGANYVVLYQMLCLKTINTDGRLTKQIGEIIIPYDIEKIARDFKWFSTDTVRVALTLFQKLGLIYVDNDGVLALSGHDALIGSETDYAAQKQLQRQKNNGDQSIPEIEETSVDTSVDNVHENVHTEIDIENRDRYRDRDRDREDTTSTPQAEDERSLSCPFRKIQEMYHSICVSFPKIKAIDGNRKSAVAARWRTCRSLDVFEELFRAAEASPFLKGNNDRNWSADFDWMMKATNFTKILEHKYDFRKPDDSMSTRQNNVLGALMRMHEEAVEDDQNRSG